MDVLVDRSRFSKHGDVIVDSGRKRLASLQEAETFIEEVKQHIVVLGSFPADAPSPAMLQSLELAISEL